MNPCPLYHLSDCAARAAAAAADAWGCAEHCADEARVAVAAGDHRAYCAAVLDFAEAVQSACSAGEEAYHTHCRLRDFPTPD